MSQQFNHTFVLPVERALYRDVASSYTGAGRIIDAGCFAGGTTTALCEGIHGHFERPPIVAIDRFIVADAYVAAHFAASGVDLRMGESFLPVFLSNISAHVGLVEVRAGDVFAVSRVEDPIEIVSIDIAKSPSINSFLLMHWFPRLIPGVATLLHQDFHAPSQPWVAASMAALAPYFTVFEAKIGKTAAFRLERSIAPTALQAAVTLDWRSKDGLKSLELIHEILGAPSNRSVSIMIAKCLKHHGRVADARRIVEALFQSGGFEDDPKWKQWLGMAAATLHPSILSSKQFAAEIYDEDGRFRLGHW
ncbi:hypothetical protein V8017_08180 [Stenotrophomonas rhizophila]